MNRRDDDASKSAFPQDGGHRPPLQYGPMSRRVPIGVWLLGLVSLLMDVSSEIINALLPLYLVGSLGASVALVGLLEAFGNAVATVTRLVSGVWSDRTASRKRLALLGYGLAALSKPLVPLTGSVVGIAASKALDRIGKGIRTAPRDALVVDLTAPGNRGEAFGLRKAMDTVGGFVGPLLAMALMVAFANDVIAVFWVAALPALAAIGVLAFGVREPASTTAMKSTVVTWRDAGALTPRVWAAVGVTAGLSLARFGEAFLLLRATEVGLPARAVPLVLVVLHAFYGLTSYPAGRLSDRIGRGPLLSVGLVVLMGAHLTIGMAPSVAVFWLGIVFWGVHMGLTQSVLSSVVADVAPLHLRGSAFGVQAIASGAALAVGNVLAGWLWTSNGSRATFVTAAAIAAVGFALVISRSKAIRRDDT